jgi:hypothetical protein
MVCAPAIFPNEPEGSEVNTMRTRKSEQLLRALVEQFIDEQLEMRRISLENTVEAYTYLIGLKEPFAALGFVAFLQAFGIKHPMTKDFTSHNVGLHWEFLAQRYGVLRALVLR